MDSAKLKDDFLSYHLEIESDMKVGWGSNYKHQYIGKEKLRQEGRISISINCSDEALQI